MKINRLNVNKLILYILRKNHSKKKKEKILWSKICENFREKRRIDYFKHSGSSDAKLKEFVRSSSPDTLYARLSLSLSLSFSLFLCLSRSHPRRQKMKSAPFEFDPTDVYPATFRFLVPQGNADASPRWYITVSWKTPSEIREPWASSGFTYECMKYHRRVILT